MGSSPKSKHSTKSSGMSSEKSSQIEGAKKNAQGKISTCEDRIKNAKYHIELLTRQLKDKKKRGVDPCVEERSIQSEKGFIESNKEEIKRIKEDLKKQIDRIKKG